VRPPPYAREFMQARRSGEYINPWLFAGRGAWQRAAQRGPGRLVLPEGEQPETYDWKCCAGLVLVVSWPAASVQEVDALGAILVRSGATAVLVLDDAIADIEARRYRVLRPFRRYVRRAA
jgi:hypothetical protein